MKKTGGNPPKFHQVEVVMVEVPKRPGRHGKKMGGQSLFWRQASASVVSVDVELVLANWMHPKLALKTAEATRNDHGASSGCRRMNFAGAAPRPTRKFRMWTSKNALESSMVTWLMVSPWIKTFPIARCKAENFQGRYGQSHLSWVLIQGYMYYIYICTSLSWDKHTSSLAGFILSFMTSGPLFDINRTFLLWALPGPMTTTFQRCDHREDPDWACFSLLFTGRTLDLAVAGDLQIHAWLWSGGRWLGIFVLFCFR